MVIDLPSPPRLSPLAIGPVTVECPIVLAPMTGVTDMPFRRLVRRYGSGLNVTEMIASPAMIRETRQSLDRKSTRLNSSHERRSRMPSSA